MKTFLLLTALIFAFAACKKEPEKEKIPNSNLTGALILNKKRQTLYTYPSGNYDSYSEYMMGFFLINGTFDVANAGTIRCGDSTLKNTGGFSYTSYIHNPQPRSGFTGALDGAKLWTVSGNTSSNVPAFSLTSPASFPSLLVTDFSSIPVINRSVPYTVTWDNSVPCDSMEIHIKGGSKTVSSGIIAGNRSSYTFSAAQLSVFEPSI
jgi:hypothetical protein